MFTPTMFSRRREVLPRVQWLQLWDHLIARGPSIVVIIVAIIIIIIVIINTGRLIIIIHIIVVIIIDTGRLLLLSLLLLLLLLVCANIIIAGPRRGRCPPPSSPSSWSSEASKRGRIKRGCSQKPDLQIGGKTGPRHIQNTGRVPCIRPRLIRPSCVGSWFE